MTIFVRTWDAAYEASPPDSQSASQGATRIRETRVDIGERLEVDHSLAGNVDDGAHKKVTLLEQVSDPASATDTGFLYSKDVGGVTEVFYEDSGGLIIQLTSAGIVRLSDLANLLVVDLLGVASAVNYVEHGNAITGNAPYSKAGGSDTDIDYEVDGKGTGRATNKGLPLVGMYTLPTPESLLSVSSTATVPTAINSATLNAAGATKAYLSIDATFFNTNAVYFSKATFTKGAIYRKLKGLSGQGASNTFVVDLDANNDFWYATDNATTNLDIILLGYSKT